MLMLRRYSNPDTISEEIQIDEIDFDLVAIYLKTYLVDPETHKIEIKRFWGTP